MVESIFRQLKQYHFSLHPDDVFEIMTKKVTVGIDNYKNKTLDVYDGLTSNAHLLLYTKDIHPDFEEYTEAEI
jgi:hypothetical protein